MTTTSEPPFAKPDRDYLVFYLLMTLVIAGVYVSTLMTQPELHIVWRLVVYTLLINVHVALHWFLEKFADRGWTLPYVIIQGMLALTIVFLSNSITMIFGLYMPLMGEIAGLQGLNRKSVLPVLFYLALSIINFTGVNGSGSLGWWALATIPGAFFTILYTTMYIRQAQARERAQVLLKELEAANQQLREYAARVEDLTITAERERMARELHDTLSQGLAGVILQLEAVDAHLAGGRGERAQAILQQTMERARTTLADARRAIDDLRQPASPDLEGAVRQEVDHFSESTGIHCDLELDDLPAMPEVVSDAARRTVAEALTNIARHSQAKSAILRITSISNQNELEIEISDDGIGFDPEAVAAGHYGLLGMRERVRLAGGRFEVRSEPGKGTQIVIRFPLEKNE